METIKDIVREIRNSQNGNVHTISAKEAYALADRIEAAHKHELERGAEAAQICGEIGEIIGRESVTDCNQQETVDIESRCIYGEAKVAEPVGNAAKMREALEEISTIKDQWYYGDDTRSARDLLVKCGELAEAALAEPLRNCDLYETESKAYQAYLTAMKNATKKTYVYYEPWLFAEAKGE